MKAGNYYGGKDFRVEDIPDPVLTVGEVLIRVTAVGICGSDLHEYRAEYPSQTGKPGRILGHELAGVITQVADGVDNKLSKGMRVGVNPLTGCQKCERCRAGMSYLCYNGKTLGIQRPGGFAEFTTVPQENCYPLPDNVSNDAASLLDVYACALHGLTRLPVKPGDRVVVIGTGAMAISFAELSHLSGASEVALVGRHKETTEIAAALANATPVAASEQNPTRAIRAWTGRRGADIVFECAGGTEQTLTMGMAMARQGGSIGVEGVLTRPQTIDPINAMLRELTITWFYSHGRRGERNEMEIVLDLMAQSRLEPERLITHHFPLAQIEQAFFTADNHAANKSIKVVINPV